jgi:NADH-quinone oxidoreductase subunit B
MDEPLGSKRAAELAASGHRTELVPSSIKYAPKGKRHERENQLGAPNATREVQA